MFLTSLVDECASATATLALVVVASILVVRMTHDVILKSVIRDEIIPTIANISIGFTAHHFISKISFCSVLLRFSVYLRVEFSIFCQT